MARFCQNRKRSQRFKMGMRSRAPKKANQSIWSFLRGIEKNFPDKSPIAQTKRAAGL